MAFLSLISAMSCAYLLAAPSAHASGFAAESLLVRQLPMTGNAGRQSTPQAGGAAYDVQQGGGRLVLQNLAHGLQAALGEGGLTLRSGLSPESGESTLTLLRQGCAEHPDVARRVAPVVAADHRRIEYVRSGITEWYENSPLGLEHGFTVAHDLGCARGKLLFALSLGGKLHAALVGKQAQARVELKADSRGEILRYGGLSAADADGRRLPARLSLSDHTIRLEVDAAGARYPVTIDPTWTQQSKLQASDGYQYDNFGYRVAVSGDTAVVGAYHKNVGANQQQGQAYVYVRTAGSWTQQAILVDSANGSAYNVYGSAVAISGNTILIGAPSKSVGTTLAQGQVYVYVRTGTAWTQQAILTASDGAQFDGFGISVAIDGDTAVVGASGKNVGANTRQGQSYVYVRTGTTWTQQAILVDTTTGESADYFGVSVDVSGNTALIGASGKTVGMLGTIGQTYVYARAGTTWSQQAALTPSDGAGGDEFGAAVALDGDTAVVGAYNKSLTYTQQGEAYVYVRSGTSWSEQTKLISSQPSRLSGYGSTVAVSGDTAVIGSFADDDAAIMIAGQAYVYTRTGTTWSQEAKLSALDAATNDSFGFSVAIDVDTIVVGADGKTGASGALQGAAYAFARTYPLGTACSANSHCASRFCVDGVCCDTACGNADPTDCQACSTTAGGAANGTCSLLPDTAVCDSASGQRCSGNLAQCPSGSGDGGSRGGDAGGSGGTAQDGGADLSSGGSQATGCSCSLPGARPGPLPRLLFLVSLLALLALCRRSVRRN